MNLPKIHFSAEEIELVRNQQWLLTKNNIISKIYDLMGQLSERLQLDFVQAADELSEKGPKISRGENYHGLPYVMLDFPRYFDKQDICALRTFFWWGHFISITLHLKGKYQQQIVPTLVRELKVLAVSDFRLCLSGDEWDHDLMGVQYQSISDNREPFSAAMLSQAPFVKISSAIMLEQWDQIQDKVYSKQQLLYQLITDQFPKR